MLGLVENKELVDHVRPYSKILKDGSLLDKTNKHGGWILKDISKIVKFG